MNAEKNKNEAPFVCFGGIDWWYHNRSHIDPQLTKHFAKRGTALYINSIVMTKLKTGEKGAFFRKVKRKLVSILRGLNETEYGFWVYSPFSMPVHHRKWLKRLNDILVLLQVKFVLWKLRIKNPLLLVANPAAVDIVFRLKNRGVVYQRTDRFEEANGVDISVIESSDRRLKMKADLTVFVNSVLFNEEKEDCQEAIFLDHGVDYAELASPRVPPKPSDMIDIKGPIIGYFGAVYDHSVDVDLVAKVAECLCDMSFVFVGTVYEEYPVLFNKQNVYALGQKDYKQIPAYGSHFDVCILPWCDNRWTQASNPIKIKEYLALGKPIVSTSHFSEIDSYRDLIYVANSAEKFAAQIREALAQDNGARIAARRKKVECDSWESKVATILKRIH